MKNSIIFLTLLLFTGAAIECAHAKKSSKKTATTSESATGNQTSGGNAEDNFAKFDRNHNNYLDRREWPGDASIFSKLDRNHDGKLSRQEYTQDN